MNFAPAILYAVSSSTLLAVALAFLRGGLNSGSVAIAVSFGLMVAAFAFWQERNATPAARKSPTPWEWAAIVAFALVSLRMFLWVVFIESDDIKVLSPNNLGDLSLHLTYVRYLANGAPFWPENPIVSGESFSYPVGVDLFHGMLVLLGLDTLRGFVWMGLAGSALTGAALWRWGRGFVLFGFLANGGLFALTFLQDGKFIDFQGPYAWKSFALALLATQRGLLFALPAGLFLLSSWRARFFGGDGPALPRWGEVLLYASMPLFHFHTFLFLSVLLATWFLLQNGSELFRTLSFQDHDESTETPISTGEFTPSARWEVLILVGAAFIPATILVFLVTGGFHGKNMLGWKPGWMWEDEAFLTWCRNTFGGSERRRAAELFWPMNFGALPLYVILLLDSLWQKRDTWARAVVIPSLLLFLVCCFVKFAPWEWDNTKLMIWSYLCILPFLWSKVLMRWPEWARYASCIVLFASGFLSTLGGIDASHRGHSIAERSVLDGVAHAVRKIPITEGFAGAPTYNHPLLLCGRRMALGYLGHVASHGLDWQVPSAKLDRLMQGDVDWRTLARDLHCRYLFWGSNEDEIYPSAEQPWKQDCERVAFGDWGAIYDLQSAPVAEPARPPAAE